MGSGKQCRTYTVKTLKTIKTTSATFEVEMGLVLFGLRKNTHTPVSGSAVPSVANTRLIRVLEGEGATPVRSISAVGMAAKWVE